MTPVSTNLALNDALILEAKELGNHRTKRDAVNAALEEYVQKRQRLRILELTDTIEYDEDYDIIAFRKRDAHRMALLDEFSDEPPADTP